MRLFEITPNGDPYSRAWDCREYVNSFDEDTCVFRGDLGHTFGRDALIRYLRRNYPGCKIRVTR